VDLEHLPQGELVVRRLEWGELVVDSAPVEFVTSGERLWHILGFPAWWPEFTIKPPVMPSHLGLAPDGFRLVGGILTVNGTNLVVRYEITDYLPSVGGYWLERIG
jgi:hypothetical protein